MKLGLVEVYSLGHIETENDYFYMILYTLEVHHAKRVSYARGEGTFKYSARLFTPGKRKALAKSKVRQ